MKFRFLLLLLLLSCGWSFGQKSTVDFVTSNNWTKLGRYDISENGKFVWYFTSSANGDHLRICSTDGNQSVKVKYDVSDCKFTYDSKAIIIKTSGDSIFMYDLGSKNYKFMGMGQEYFLSRAKKDEILSIKNGSILSMLKFRSRKKFVATHIENFKVTDEGTKIIFLGKNDNGSATLSVFNFDTFKLENTIQVGNCISYFPDKNGSNIGLITENQGKYTIWQYTTGKSKPEAKVTDNSDGIKGKFLIENKMISFGKEGKQIFFFAKPIINTNLNRDPDVVNGMEVWTYKDSIHYSQQANFSERKFDACQFVLNAEDNKAVQLTQAFEDISFSENCSDFVLVKKNVAGANEFYWNPFFSHYSKVISTVTGKVIKKLSASYSGDIAVILSPDNKYILYFDTLTNDYFSQDLRNSWVYNLTKNIKIPHTLPETAISAGSSVRPAFNVIGWLKDNNVLLGDGFDIWKLDLTGRAKPLNLTNGWGRRNNISFFSGSLLQLNFEKFGPKDSIPFLVIDQNTLKSGFTFIKLDKINIEPKITFQNCLSKYKMFYHGSPLHPKIIPNYSGVFLFEQETASSSPNLFVSRDFKKYEKLSDIHPERTVNWLTSELVIWKAYDGKEAKGVIYKPENFDPKKKYPIIFYYYVNWSNNLNKFLEPNLSYGLSIPFYVSNGYLVFVPDIIPKKTAFGESAYNSVVSVADYLSKFDWIDKERMGLAGYSFGGYETNFLVGKSSLFACAYSGAGASNLISSFGEGPLQMMYCEQGAYGIGFQPWERPDLYIKNSPIFYVDKVTTPLLILNNRGDDNVPFAQGLEFFNSLRRLRKKVWMLHYPGEGHGLNGKNQEDFSKRQFQFFNHYLKAKPAPIWMTEGIGVSVREMKSGLELDSSRSFSNKCRHAVQSLKIK
ncbi:alpha/beta hydrolase family protein [Pedobacter ginsenosidimutans]|nr:prolyl oligopeptidase family serine peptidase [Pedobacter ginsenosidimutans]